MDGHWSFGAAGHVERDESVHAAAVREVYEELGVHVRESDLEPICTMHRRSGGNAVGQRVDFFFAAREWEGDPSVAEPDKSGGIRWAALGSLPEPMVPYVVVVLEMLRTGKRDVIVHTGF